MKVQFQGISYQLVITDHAEDRMKQRNIIQSDVIRIIETGKIKAKQDKNKFWVFKKLSGRNDNLICLSISLEDPFLIVVTALVNWRPHEN